ncbi:DUF2254 domain-containing protein [Pseudomonas sp. gcc21]|uniref:DUF2254 domain-containing protein n=1 Tax=Pseudomonas sp. gcc21 TaxID=2726989 RepID=UPI0015B3C924|nr:DUF2254 domain-containing protein [Pseudomonas sp. gcc21]
MISKWQWILNQIGRMLWVRASLFALLGIGSALLATASDQFWPGEAPIDIGSEAVSDILNILASSMLAVTTFSLTVMVSAYGTATSNITPRATRLLMQDTTTHNVLGTFLGSFLFSLVGIIALHTEIYGERGRMILFAFTLLVIVIIAATMLRWIDHLTHFGRMADTTARVEAVILKALDTRIDNPAIGAQALYDPEREIPPTALPVHPGSTGYIGHIDIGELSAWAEENDAHVYLVCTTGSFVNPLEPLAWVDCRVAELPDTICEAFTIGSERSFDQDPRFGLVVMAEIASRALSPGINDPGTAIDVLGRVVRLFTHWNDNPDIGPMGSMAHARIHVPPMQLDDLFDDIFTPIGRDGAALIEVQVRLHKSLKALAARGGLFADSAAKYSALALKRSELAMELEEDKERLRKLSGEVVRLASAKRAES